jgi:hypothetical protein
MNSLLNNIGTAVYEIMNYIGTAAWVILIFIIGILMDRSGKPYGIWKPIVHILLFIFIAGGIFSCFYGVVFQIHPLRIWVLSSVIVMMATSLCNLIIGLIMLTANSVKRNLVSVHLISAILLAVSLIAGAVFQLLRI